MEFQILAKMLKIFFTNQRWGQRLKHKVYAFWRQFEITNDLKQPSLRKK